MTTQSKNKDKKTDTLQAKKPSRIIKRMVLLFFIILIPLFVIYVLTIGRFNQSLIVSFDETTKISRSQYLEYNDAPLEIDGFIINISKVKYEKITTDDLSHNNYTGNIKLSKTDNKPIKFDSASVEYVLKTRWNTDEEIEIKTGSTNLTSGNGLSFSMNYHLPLPYKYMFAKINHPTLLIHIYFNDNSSGGNLAVPITHDYYIMYHLNPSIA